MFKYKIFLFIGEFIKPNETKCVLNEGMPMYKNPFEKGRLIINFNVKFPADKFDLKTIAALEKILPAKPKVDIPKDAVTYKLIDLDPSYARGKRQDAYDEDDLEGGPQRVQCANQ